MTLRVRSSSPQEPTVKWALRPYIIYLGVFAPVLSHIDLTSILNAYFLPSTVLGLKEVTLNRLHVACDLSEFTEEEDKVQ